MPAFASRVSRSFLRAVGAAFLFWAASVFPARATTFVVTTTADGVHGSCGSPCSLRDAIIAANANPGADIITLPSSPGVPYTLQIPGANEDNAATGDLDIKEDLTINGGGAPADTIINGANLDRVFQIFGNITVVFNNVTIQSGFVTGDGGGIFAPTGTVTLNNCVVKNNFATGQGAGINAANLVLNNTTVSFNTSTGDQGGGLFLINGTFTITNSTFDHNSANQEGGGIYLNGSINPGAPALLTIADSTFSGNQGSAGGGMFILSQATVSITGSTFLNNNALTGGGGGINNSGATLSLTNCTFDENVISGGTTGGTAIFNSGGNVSITNCTIDSGVMVSGPGAGLANGSGTMNVRNTIVTNNSGGNCSGTIIDSGGNLQGATDCGTMTQGSALLQALDNNGGPTQTQALGVGSAAIDHAVGCPPPATDQRGAGFTRPQGAACDTGAFECQPAEPCFAVVATATPTPTQPGATATPTPTFTPAPPTATATSAPPTATATAGAAAVVVPTLSFPMMGLLGLALAGAAFLLLRQRV